MTILPWMSDCFYLLSRLFRGPSAPKRHHFHVFFLSDPLFMTRFGYLQGFSALPVPLKGGEVFRCP